MELGSEVTVDRGQRSRLRVIGDSCFESSRSYILINKSLLSEKLGQLYLFFIISFCLHSVLISIIIRYIAFTDSLIKYDTEYIKVSRCCDL